MSTACPTPAILTKFAAGEALDEETVQSVGNHLDICQSCFEIVASASNNFSKHSTEGLIEGSISSLAEQRFNWEKLLASKPSRLGKYPINQVLAHGGMSVVYSSTHPNLQKEIVIKALPCGRLLSSRARDRIISEQKILGSLNHPNIVAALDADIQDGIPFIVLERVEGRTLAQILAEDGPFPLQDACAVTAVLAKVLHCIHEKGLVHRDVKPSNVVLTEGGHVKLLDFGLAFSSEGSDACGTAGTPSFMAPEQSSPAQGVDRNADTYALGKTLLALCFGTPKQQSWKTLPRPLQTLVGRMLHEEPNNRPDLKQEVLPELIKFASTSTNVCVDQFATPRGSRLAAKFYVLPSIAILALIAFLVTPWFEPSAPVTTAVRVDYPRPAPKIAKWSPSGKWIASFGDDGHLCTFEFVNGQIVGSRSYKCFDSSDIDIPTLLWLNDNRLLVGSSNREPTKVIALEDGGIVASRHFDSEITSATLDAERKAALLAFSDGSLHAVDFRLNTVCYEQVFESQATTALAMYGEDVAIGAASGQVTLLKLVDQRELAFVSSFSAGVDVQSIAWHPTGNQIYVGTSEGEVLCFNRLGQVVPWPQPEARGIVRSLSWDDTGELLAVGSWDAFVWEPQTETRFQLNNSSSSNWSQFSWNGENLLLSSYDAGLVHWTASNRQANTLFESSRQQVVSIAWRGNEEFAVATGRGDLFVYTMEGRRLHWHASKIDNAPLSDLSWSPSEKSLCAVHEWSNVIEIYDTNYVSVIQNTEEKALRCATWIDDIHLAYAGMGGVLYLFDSQSGVTYEEVEVGAAINGLDFDPMKSQIVVSTEADGIKTIDLVAGNQAMLSGEFLSNIGTTDCCWVQPNRAIVSCRDYSIRVVGTDSGRILRQFPTTGSIPRRLSSNTDLGLLGCGGIGILDTTNLSLSLRYVPPREYTYSWSHDDRFLATGNWIDEIAVWDLGTKTECWRSVLPYKQDAN